MPTAETEWQEKAAWHHGNRAMGSINLYGSHAEKTDKGQTDEYMILVGFMKEAEAVSGKRKTFSNHEICWESIKLKTIVSHSWI